MSTATPITPASDILHDLERHKNFGVGTFQAEDEIAAVGAALGASFGGALGACTSSGPGVILKQETIGLAVTLELPLLILDIQLRGGSGFRLLKLMLAAGMTRPETIIVVTNYPSDDYRTASRECGADHFFDKASEFHKVREVLLEMR